MMETGLYLEASALKQKVEAALLREEKYHFGTRVRSTLLKEWNQGIFGFFRRLFKCKIPSTLELTQMYGVVNLTSFDEVEGMGIMESLGMRHAIGTYQDNINFLMALDYLADTADKERTKIYIGIKDLHRLERKIGL